MIFPFIYKNRLQKFFYPLLIMGKTLDTYQKDKKYSFSCPAKPYCVIFRGQFVKFIGNFVMFHYLLIMGKTLDAYQKDKKIFIFLPSKGLLRYFQSLICKVSGEFCDIHAALETSRALLNVSQVHVRTQNASKQKAVEKLEPVKQS